MIIVGMMIGDRYEILDKIGTGGMSDVYKAKDHKLNRSVAVKVLKPEFNENTGFVSKFRTEAQAAAGLSHPNIVGVYDVGEEDGIYYIVMELVEGITLKNYIEKKSRLSIKEAISIAIQVSMGIEAAHNNHIIHRDIKPQNIMISKDGKVKVTDFGIAKAATSNTITSNVMGSVHYTSPEQARGGFSDEKSDIYSLGCTMFEMLTGHVPFDGETTVAIAIKHIQDEMPTPREYVPEIPVSVEKIIMKCTQKSADRRYQNMSELIADLKRSLITPDEDFVTMVDIDNSAATRPITDDELMRIKERTGSINVVGQSTSSGEHMRLSEEEVERRRAASMRSLKIIDEDEEEDDYYEDDEEKYQKLSRAKAVRKAERTRNSGRRNPYSDDSDTRFEEDFSSKDNGYDDYDDEMDNKMEKITTVIAIVAAVIIGIIALVVVAKAIGAFGSKDDKEDETVIEQQQEEESEGDVMVENVVGMDIAVAKPTLENVQLKVNVEYVEDDTNGENKVISQSIEAGKKVPANTEITLKVSSGPAGVVLTDVVGLSEDAAITRLSDAGFQASVDYAYSDTVTKDMVISQNPSAGEKVASGTIVSIIVSSGPEENGVEVPDLVGKTQDAANSAIKDAGFKTGTVKEDYSDTVEKGKVISQSPSAGSKVEKDNSISYTVSLGKKDQNYNYVSTINAPTGYTGGTVTITLTVGNDKKTFTTDQFPFSINESGFKAESGTLSFAGTKTETVSQPVTDADGNPVLDDAGNPQMSSTEQTVPVDLGSVPITLTKAEQ